MRAVKETLHQSERPPAELTQMILIEAQQLRYQQRLAFWERRAEAPRG